MNPKQNQKITQIVLVSDGTSTAAWTNQGFTLPGRTEATYDISLSPLFFNRSGETNLESGTVILYQGSGAQFWAGSSRSGRTWAYIFNLSASLTSPSTNYYRYFGNSLRCLVSTNNGIMINPNS